MISAMEQLTGLDATFLYMETPSLHMHISMVAVLDPATVPGGYSYQKLRDLVGARLALAPVFRRRLVEVPFGSATPIGSMIRPSTSITTCTERRCPPRRRRRAGPVRGRCLQSSARPFQASVGNAHRRGLEHGRVAMISKIHHSTIDGVSGAELLAQLFDLEA